ncbi:NADP-dependent phosphogluconate dehydrogenase [Sungkyunkwania multivorans]|uniref:6-phosphogluconate dehydrogenase, decarboxylating n=1 Tax=Sungkyunkwania multivorans TaxID=1173618 RepID=A0ABW3CUQ0_9FLAO
MGVSGVGKTTVGKLLSGRTNLPFFDGDDFHPEANKQKMASGNPLTDKDRSSWLQALNDLANKEQERKGAIIACSALKEKYRIQLKKRLQRIYFVHLEGSFELIKERMVKRTDHFMPTDLLRSQFETLEKPNDAITLSVEFSPEEIVHNIYDILFNPSEFGVIGLGVMGKSLCRNLAQNGFKISMYNRHVTQLEEKIAIDFKSSYQELSDAKAFDDISNFIHSIATPRKIMLMVNAGEAVDKVIRELQPMLDAGDVIIDGGNSHYKDTYRRMVQLKESSVHFMGVGISGGEEGALKGPSIMPGGAMEAYKEVGKYLETIAAKDADGTPCCSYLGPEGSGHYVKMVHNGIEYAEMQLLAEAYHLLKLQHKNPDEIAKVFIAWNKGELNSFLLETSIDILKKKEGDDWLIDKILDKAANKGTGNWTTVSSAALGTPSTMIASALFARYVSAFKEERQKGALLLGGESTVPNFSIEDLKNAYQLARVINHHQGFELLKAASSNFKWNLNLNDIARIWTNGCIIRSRLMKTLSRSMKSELPLLFETDTVALVRNTKASLRSIVRVAIDNDISLPCFTEALTYLNGISTSDSPANLIQAQRDHFGAHTYQRVDKEGSFHTNWKNDPL